MDMEMSYFESEIDVELVDGTRQILISTPKSKRRVYSAIAFPGSIWDSRTLENMSQEKVKTWVRNMGKILQLVYEEHPISFEISQMLLKKCFMLHISDSQLVVGLLKISDTLQPESRDNVLCKEADICTYFLRHAKDMRMTFEGKWFGEKSHEMIVNNLKNLKVESLRILLQNGFCSSRRQSSYSVSVTTLVSFDILCGFNSDLKQWFNRDDVPHTSKLTVIKCLELWRVFGVPSSEIGCLFLDVSVENMKIAEEKLLLMLRAIPVSSSVLPTDIIEHKGKGTDNFIEVNYSDQTPCNLQQLCRCAIRERLGKRLQLPDGIRKLHLCNFLCDYLNLEID